MKVGDLRTTDSSSSCSWVAGDDKDADVDADADVDVDVVVHAGAPTPTINDADINRSVCDVIHVGEERLSVETIRIPLPDTLEAVTPVCGTSTSTSNGISTVEGEGEGEVVFWHMGDNTQDVIERARVVALTPIKAEEAVVRVEVEVEVVEISPEAKDEEQD